MLKVDLHLHTSEDPSDGWHIKYSARELISHMAKLGYDVIAITNHGKVTFNKELYEFAKQRGILLIPGAEVFIEGKEVLLLNVESIDGIKRFSDIKKLKDALVVAPHPFYPKKCCLWGKLAKNISLFDAIEYCHCYGRFINPFNKLAVKASKRYGKRLLGTSDAHDYFQIGSTYSLVDSEKNKEDVILAIRRGKVKIVTNPLSFFNLARMIANMIKYRIVSV